MILCCFDDTVGLPIKVISVMLRSMLTGVCKLTVDAIMLALLSFINFVTSNRSLHEYNLLVMAWHCRDTLFFFVIVSKIIILKQVSFWQVYASIKGLE